MNKDKMLKGYKMNEKMKLKQKIKYLKKNATKSKEKHDMLRKWKQDIDQGMARVAKVCA